MSYDDDSRTYSDDDYDEEDDRASEESTRDRRPKPPGPFPEFGKPPRMAIIKIQWLREFLAELLGTFILVAFGDGSVAQVDQCQHSL